jgi:Arm DNA-binding domain
MPKFAKELSPVEVRRLMGKPGLHAVGGVTGLFLQVSRGRVNPDVLRRSWILRATVGAKRRDIGLGSFPDVTLQRAREKARALRDQIGAGLDPVEERRKVRAALIAQQAAALSFREAARKFVAIKVTEFQNVKHAAQWLRTLETYAYPMIGNLPVSDVELEHVVAVLEPIWLTKTETAARLRGRIEAVLAWATVSKFRSGPNPARWKGNLDAVLPKPGKVMKVKHFEALPIDDMGGFMQRLRSREGTAARAVEFQILTATWSGAIRFARWAEIELERKVWTIPGGRLLKRGEMDQFRVPLSDDAVALLRGLGQGESDALVFPAPKRGPLSDMSLTAVMRRLGLTATVHGTARSTFKDWAAERTSYDNIVSEAALAHVNGCKVEQSYRRGDMFERRRRLMRDWSEFCGQPSKPKDRENIIAISGIALP